MEKRSTRRPAKMYALKAYYNFICSVESIYLTNLNMRMIRAYADGDIMDVILGGILKTNIWRVSSVRFAQMMSGQKNNNRY